jgi:hypothetical protein
MRTYSWIMVVLLAGAVGCGGDDDGADGGDDVADDGDDLGDGGDDGGVDSATPLSELSNSDAEALCDEVADTLDGGLDALQTVTCYLTGIAMGEEACDAAVEDCLAEEPMESPISCELSAGAELPECAADVTVGDFLDCFDGFIGVWEGLADEVSCDSDPADIGEGLAAFPEACVDLYELCPELPGNPE